MIGLNETPPNRRWIFGVIIAVATILRLFQACLRWDEVSWLYAAYPGATVDALKDGQVWTAMTSFTGLHPPLWPFLHAVSEIFLPIPALWLLSSALASLGAVYLICRQSLWAGALLATAPIQLHYAAEVNNYPLATLWIALAWTGHQKAKQQGKWAILALAGVLAGWTHVLAGLAVAAVALTLPRNLSTRVLCTMFFAASPLFLEAGDLLRNERTTQQPPFIAHHVFSDYITRFGPWSLLSLPAVYIGVRKKIDIGIAWLATGLLLAGLITLGIAAPHQFPYLLFLSIPGALILAASTSISWGRKWITALIFGQLCWAIYGIGSRTIVLQNNDFRAIDQAIEELQNPWTCQQDQPPTTDCTGDAIVLLAPPGYDDDKNQISPVLWRLSPWIKMPRVAPYQTTDDHGQIHPFAHHDYRHGQPRLYENFVVYVHDEPRNTLEYIREAHNEVQFVIYEQGQREAYTTDLERRFGVEPERFGNDLIFRLP